MIRPESMWRSCAAAGAVLWTACFQATLEAPPADASVAGDTDDRDAEPPQPGEDAAPPDHPACAAAPSEPPASTVRFERAPFWDEEALNAFLAQDCEAVAPLPACDRDSACAYGKCLQLRADAPGVCVDDARCEAPLAFRDGRCSACVRRQEKAAICCQQPQGVDCRRWPPGRDSGLGGFCSEDGDCEGGLWCAAGRGEHWLGTCACPGASLAAISTFQGCGTPDTARDSEPELPVFTLENPAHPWFIGDGIAAEVVNYVRYFLEETDKVRFKPDPVSARQAAICDFLLERESVLPDDAQRLRASLEQAEQATDLIVLQFWGHAASPCMAGLAPGSEPYYARILDDAMQAVAEIEAAAQAKARRRPRLLWVLQGPDAEQPARVRRLNAIYRLVASEHGDRTSDAGHPVSMAANGYLLPNPDNRYVWTEFLPCTEMEVNTPGFCTDPDVYGVTRIHRAGEQVHFCLIEPNPSGVCPLFESPGLQRYASVIHNDIARWLDL